MKTFKNRKENSKPRKISATCFNDQKSLECLNIKINFDNILSAKILDFSTYETPIELINKIEKNRGSFQNLGFLFRNRQ